MHICNPSNQEAEEGGLKDKRPELNSNTLSQKSKRI
jgi:hypothetical protein